MKKCCICKEYKPLVEFYRQTVRKDGRQRHCKICSRTISRAWEKSNSKKHYARTLKWAQNNPGKRNAQVAQRAAQQLQATPAWADLTKIRKYYEGAALLGLAVDHVVPLKGNTVCGLHCESNFQMLTRFANSSKGNRNWPDEWTAKP